MAWLKSLIFSFLLVFAGLSYITASINLKVRDIGASGMSINVTWNLARNYPSVDLEWESVTYVSEPMTQVSSQFVGRKVLDKTKYSHLVSENLKLDQQYKFCIKGTDENCPCGENFCALMKVPRFNKVQKGPPLYLVMGPVLSTSVTVFWATVPRDGLHVAGQRNDIGYKLEWRRIDGRVAGHPGHSSNVVSNTHIIRGLQPATRYEICVGETLNGKEGQSCDLITTDEDYPGPPVAESSACYSHAIGTHWRCDFSWSAPHKPNGKIRKYIVLWRDQEGYDLLESSPRGALCDPICVDTQVLNFHPYEVCVKARTTKGFGWEDCVMVADISGRIIAFFELRVMIIILVSILFYRFGLKLLKAILRCCIRALYATLEQEKEHPV